MPVLITCPHCRVGINVHEQSFGQGHCLAVHIVADR